jgi:hypothetical protein
MKDFVIKIVGNYTTVSSYEDGVFTSDPFVIGVPNGTKLQNITVHAKFIENQCTECNERYNLKLQIIEYRPTFESADKNLPTLVVWHGWASPRGAFDFHITEGVGHLMAPHYFEKDTSKMYYIMLKAGTKFEVMETRRYFNKDLWPKWTSNYESNVGVIGYQESDISALLWVDGPIAYLSPWQDVEVKETIHRKCKEKWTSLGKVGCAEVFYRQKEDGQDYIKYDEKEIKVGDVFTYHRPEIESHKEEIQVVLGKVNLRLQDKCDWLPDTPQCDKGDCTSCSHDNEWRIAF